MANGNGYKTAIAVIVFALTLLGSAIGIYSVFHVPLREAIAKEVEARQEAVSKEVEARQSEDKEIRKDLTSTCKELTATLSDIRAQMSRVETKLGIDK